MWKERTSNTSVQTEISQVFIVFCGGVCGQDGKDRYELGTKDYLLENPNLKFPADFRIPKIFTLPVYKSKCS
jgi:hypothetical protein